MTIFYIPNPPQHLNLTSTLLTINNYHCIILSNYNQNKKSIFIMFLHCGIIILDYINVLFYIILMFYYFIVLK